MSFLKLGDLIDGGHPVTVGDDGTVFTRLNVSQSVDSIDEASTSTQEICVDDLPIDFLSDSSLASLAKDVELTVINFEDCQKEGFLLDSEPFRRTSPSDKCNVEENATSFLDLDDYQFACASNELLESCLRQDTNERTSENEESQFLTEDLFIPSLDDTIENAAQLFQCKSTLDTAQEKEEEIAPISEPIPNYSRVLFDIGNLSCGIVPEHQGFIKLTPEDCIPAVQDFFSSDTNDLSANLQLISPESSTKEKEESNECNLETEITFEPVAATEKQSEPSCEDPFTLVSTAKFFSPHDLTCGVLPEPQGFIKLTPEVCIPEAQDCFSEEPTVAVHLQPEAADTSILNDSFDKPFICSSSPLTKVKHKDEETVIIDSETDVTSEISMIFDIDDLPKPIAFELSKQCNKIMQEGIFSLDSNDTSSTLQQIGHKPSIREESNSETEDTFEPKATTVKPSATKYKCPEPDCDETFPSLSSAKHHQTLVHGPIKPFHCTVENCGLAFRYASYLARHVRSKHDGVREHECTECGHRFSTSRDLSVHQQKHINGRPVPCRDPDCKMTFSARAAADTHFLIKHRMVKQHMCEECGKAFGTLSNLKEHSVTHTGAKDFACEVSGCGKAFQTKGKLKRHGLSHLKVRPYQCDRCDRSFRTCLMLNGHVAKKHCDDASVVLRTQVDCVLNTLSGN